MVYWHESLLLYIVYFLVPANGVDPSREACISFESSYHLTQACECVTFQSYGLSKGQFHSPNYPRPYRPGINCILYTFIGDVNEIVEIKFLNMDLKAPVITSPTETRCMDRIRIFNDLDRPEVNENVKHQDELCGNLAALETKNFYSSGRALILEFHTDLASGQSHSGFKGVFTFLEKSAFKTDGILQIGTQCSYDIQSGIGHTRGNFFSPRYPQNYPKSANCQYIFMGHENEHIKVLFKLIQLPKRPSRLGCDESGDFISVYDGNDKSSKPLKTFCDNTFNQQVLYSTGPYMYIEFNSDRHREKQGFAAEYEFLDRRLEGIPNIPSDRTGTGEIQDRGVRKCNDSISSKVKKNGTITSPRYPSSYQSDIICQIEFFAEGQERIQLKFVDMDLYLSAGDPDDPFECPSQDSITVYVYIDDKEEELGQYCGKKHPQQLMSSGQRMKVVFKSTSSQKDQNSGYRIDYSFRTDFGVQGNGKQDAREVCTFMFRSTLHTGGYFTSPNYGGQYPRNTRCQYIFTGRKNEKVEIEFPQFEVDGILPRCDVPTESDVVAFSNFIGTEDRKMRPYCGNRPSYPPVKSDAAFFRVTFKSNDKYDAHGFRALYRFKRTEDPAYSTASPLNITGKPVVSAGSRSQYDVIISIVTIILLCKSVIDRLFNVF